MKRLIAFAVLTMISVFGTSGVVNALQNISESVYSSSFTANNDTTLQIVGSRPGSEFLGLVIGSPTINGVITIFDGQGSGAVTKIGVVGMNTVFNPLFYVRVSSGITYTTTGNANGVTIMYRNPNLP